MTSTLLQHLNAATEIPMSTLTLLAVVCSIGMYFIRPHLVIPALAIVFYPFFVIFAVAAYATLTLLEIFPLNKYDQWLICTMLSATIGVVIGLSLIVLISKLIDHVQSGSRRANQA
jgi:uncharacterized protein YacL